MRVVAGRNGRLYFVVIVNHKTLRLCPSYVPPQSFDFLFHFGVLTALSYPLEVGLDLAYQTETIAPGTAREGILDNVAPQLYI
jgi:hypothetical protein